MRQHQEPQQDPLITVSFNRALAEHSDGLKTFAARMLNDATLAEDVAQDAFLALYRHLHEVPPAAFRPWLYRVTRNLCLDQLRRRKFKLRLFGDLSKDDESTPTHADVRADRPDQIAESREAHAAIDKAIAALPAKFRDTFLLCEVQGLSYEDASAVLGIPVKTVSTRLFRARMRFKEAVADLIKV